MDRGYQFAPDPENPGWTILVRPSGELFINILGDVRARIEADDKIRIRITPQSAHRNINDKVHGGLLLALIDQALFLAPVMRGSEGAAGGVTLDTATQFLAPVEIGEPADVVVEILRETRRMIFQRGLIEQNGTIAVAFSGTIKKAN